ncbi:MAG: bi-domain-containing oxidoreductase [Chitinophagaceae bacterium]|nr:bi-domain-containing oxidoreductase [Chitinophagaceae bacterium]
MKQVFINRGAITIKENVVPTVSGGQILVKVHHSCISSGTELASISGNTGQSKIAGIMTKIGKVYDLYKANGIRGTYDLVNAKLESNTAMGYSAAGEVVEVGRNVTEFKPGDLVACAGSTAYHADFIHVPVNLAVLLPEDLHTALASTVALGSIALQGIRRANPTLGETFLVIGLGFIGQITSQLLKVNGCRVIAVDIDDQRLQSAKESGADFIINPGLEAYSDKVSRMTEGTGADGVIITASSGSSAIISEAMKACRKKGRVIIVGDIGLNLTRSDFYAKELDIFISTSYGPGRYDAQYEEKGVDYPLPYVRWTEKRNMHEYLRLIAENRISFDKFNIRQIEIENAPNAYNDLADNANKPLFIILKYTTDKNEISRKIDFVKTAPAPVKKDRISVGIIGSGNFTQATILPVLNGLKAKYNIHSIASKNGTNLISIANAYQIDTVTTDVDALISDPALDLLVITTRHNLHASLIRQGLRAGKHVFVEKPTVTTREELDSLNELFGNGEEQSAVLMTGYNRRFSPFIREAKRLLRNRSTPLIINYRVNAGYIPNTSWVHSEEGGGRNIGEACHMYDVFNFLVAAEVEGASAFSIDVPSNNWKQNDNFTATFKYSDGSVCNLIYTALGSNLYPKEQITVFCDGKVIEINDFKEMYSRGFKKDIHLQNKVQQKGHREEFEALADCLLTRTGWPISYADQHAASLMSLEVETMIHRP